MATLTESPADIKLTKGSFTNTHIITREEITKSRRTIGVRKNPTGNSIEEYNHRLQYTLEWGEMISSTRLSKLEALNAYRIVYIPSISYPLGATSFTNIVSFSIFIYWSMKCPGRYVAVMMLV